MSKKIIHLSQSVLTFLPTAIGKFAAWFVVAMIFDRNRGFLSLRFEHWNHFLTRNDYLPARISLFIMCGLRTSEDEHVQVDIFYRN